MTTSHVKRAFKYRFYPTDAQAAELSRTFGCVRKVYNMALAARTEAWARQERVNYSQTSAMLTAWKKTEELAYLNEVSSVPLQQALRHLQGAFAHFFGKPAQYPRFKSRKKSRKSAEYTASLSASGRRLVVLDPTEQADALVREVTEVLTSMCARLYGRRAAKSRAARAVAVATGEADG
ncbi:MULTISPECIES: helix-turn-helix domain-containing protein [unclassified Streptomyces]|uniref:RNA-guided endonuclease InsQ/TnpB family protein n=1 Tax=unclassified Streptomyces TaxID=2593676 RepID=UPI003630A8F1